MDHCEKRRQPGIHNISSCLVSCQVTEHHAFTVYHHISNGPPSHLEWVDVSSPALLFCIISRFIPQCTNHCSYSLSCTGKLAYPFFMFLKCYRIYDIYSLLALVTCVKSSRVSVYLSVAQHAFIQQHTQVVLGYTLSFVCVSPA